MPTTATFGIAIPVLALLRECQPLIESLYLDEHDKIAQGQVRGNHQEKQRLFELNERIKQVLGLGG